MLLKRTLYPTKTNSYFVFGPRQVGKSRLIKGLLAPNDLYIDLLPRRTFIQYAKQTSRLHDEILTHIKKYPNALCVIDEVQKLPSLLDDVHELIESNGVRFALTGSSARKLKRGGANLLGGRAYTYRLFPLTAEELGEHFNLERALCIGTLPRLWAEDTEPVEFFKSYIETYLREEILEESLVRNIGPFSSFLDIVAANDGEIVNYSNVARECAVSVKTVQSYYQILEETFLAYKIPGWNKSPRKRLTSHARYYLFDPGVTNALGHFGFEELNPAIRGRRFEQFVILQILAKIEYERLDITPYYWRTNNGAEVDLLLTRGQKILAAIEIKSSTHISGASIPGLREFLTENSECRAYVLGTDQNEREIIPGVTLLNWRVFIQNINQHLYSAESIPC